jgi:hypothetical protein
VTQSRRFAPIWRDIAKILDVKPEHLELWDLDPGNKPVWLRDNDWMSNFSMWMSKPDNEKRFFPAPKLASTNGWTRKKYAKGEYPMFEYDDIHHEFCFKINEDNTSKELVHAYSHSVVSWALVEMPNNCGMACFTDLTVSDRHSRLGIGTLATEFAERMVLHSNYHAVCATCIYDEDEPDGMVKIFERRDWSRSEEFYNENSANIVALYFKELV